MTPRSSGQAPLIVLDDDPTGTQAVANTPVLLEWDAERLAVAASGARAVHLLTNSRAFGPERARTVVRGAVEAAIEAFGRPRLLLRGDSTLRAHLLEEYLAVVETRFGGRRVPLLVVPALPAAGRITVDGVHLIERGGVRIPLHETEYARDADFTYSNASLLAWAEERSGGVLRRSRGREIHLAELRANAGAVSNAVLELQGQAAVVAPDAETVDDLATIAAGLRAAEADGAEVVVRSAPTFAGVLAGNLARGPAAPPQGRRVLVVCGSHVPTTTRQLSALVDRHPGSLVEVDVLRLASNGSARREVERAAREAGARIDDAGLAVVATPRSRPAKTATLAAGERIAENLARIARRIDQPDVVVAKGGITSAVTARVGLRATSALCLGPLVDGVALWSLDHADGSGLPFVVFPGNVGADSTLLDVVELVRAA